MNAGTKRCWVRDIRIEPWKDRMIASLCGFGMAIPLGKAIQQQQAITAWPGDRWAILIIFAVVGAISILWDDD